MHYCLDPQSCYLREYHCHYCSSNDREIDPNEAVHLREALLIETAEAGVTLGVQRAIVFVLITIDLLKDWTRVKSLAFLFRATITRAFGVKLTKLAVSKFKGVCLARRGE